MPLSLDIEDFEAHFHAAEAAGDVDVRLAEYQAALALYAGDPLPRVTDEIWNYSNRGLLSQPVHPCGSRCDRAARKAGAHSRSRCAVPSASY